MKIHSGQAGYIVNGEKINELTRQLVRKHHNYPSEQKPNIVTDYVNSNKQQALLQYITVMGLDVNPYKEESINNLFVEPTGGINDEGIAVELYLPFNKKELPTDISPRHFARCQLNMLATKKQHCHFMVWMPNVFEIYTIERDNDWLAQALTKIEKYCNWLEQEINNPLHLEDMIQVIDDEYLVQLVREYQNLKLDIAKIESRQEEIMIELQEKVGCNAVIGGTKFVMQSRKGSTSWKKAFDELQKRTGIDLDLDQFKGKDSNFWKLG